MHHAGRWRWLIQPVAITALFLLTAAGAAIGWRVGRLPGAAAGAMAGLLAAVFLAVAVDRIALVVVASPTRVESEEGEESVVRPVRRR